jgi:hypothetical protein
MAASSGDMSHVNEISDFFEDKDPSSVDTMQDLEARSANLYSYEARVAPSKEPDTGIEAAFLSSEEHQDVASRIRYLLKYAFSRQVVVTPTTRTPAHVSDQQSLGSVFAATLATPASFEEHDVWTAIAESFEREEEVAPNVSPHVRPSPKDSREVEVEITSVRKGRPHHVRPMDLLLEEDR